MAKYKVGDKVRVKDYPVDVGPGWVDEMDKMLGKIVTIKEIDLDGDYKIKEMKYLWCDEMFESLVNGTENEVIDLLMKKLGVEIDEEFEIEEGNFNPYHFDKKGNLINSDGDKTYLWIGELAYGYTTVKKIPKHEIKEMTMEQLQEALGYPVKIVKGGE